MIDYPNPQAIETRRKIWELKTAKGYSDDQIAAELKITRAYVTRTLIDVGNQYLERITDQAIGYKMQQVAQLENIIKEALESWEWSKYHGIPKSSRTLGPVQEARAKKRMELDDEGNPIRIRGGTSTYLKVAMDAMDRIKLLLNLGATHIIRDETKEAQKLFDSLSNEELNLIINGQYTISNSPSTGQLPAGDYSESESDPSAP